MPRPNRGRTPAHIWMDTDERDMLEFMRQKFGFNSMADVVRFMIRRLAKTEEYSPDWNTEAEKPAPSKGARKASRAKA